MYHHRSEMAPDVCTEQRTPVQDLKEGLEHVAMPSLLRFPRLWHLALGCVSDGQLCLLLTKARRWSHWIPGDVILLHGALQLPMMYLGRPVSSIQIEHYALSRQSRNPIARMILVPAS